MASSFLGIQEFVTLRNPQGGDRGGAPELPREMTQVFSRIGVDGVSVRKEGKKGPPFQMLSMRDAADRTAAEQLQADYIDMVGTIVGMNWNGVNYAAVHGVGFTVLGVRDINLNRISGGVGGLVNNPQYWVSAVWDLQAFEL